MNLEKWLPLFEKCPELKPDCIYVLGGSLWFLLADEDEGGISGPAPRSIAAALIRDRAVMVGAEKWGLTLHHWDGLYRVRIPQNVVVGDEPVVIAGTWTPGFADPLEALRLACCKVLEVEP